MLWMNLFAGQQRGCRHKGDVDIKDKLVGTVGEGGCGMNGE